MRHHAPPGDLSLDEARALDARDPLASFRERFYVHPGRIYLDGNSLGLLSRDAEEAVLATLDAWKAQGVEGWTGGSRPWFHAGETLGALQAELVGAHADEVVVTGSTTLNLHALVATFYQPQGRRTRMLVDALNFPSDLYALRSQVALRGYDPADHLLLVPSRDGRTLREEDLVAALSDEVALVVLPSVLYRSGQLLDVERLTRAAHDRGIPIGFDLSHSAGVVPHKLHEWGVDFAVWCTYKYLNGGPGAVGALFVHERHFGTAPALAGWWGSHKEHQFDMRLEFLGAPGAGAWQISTPPILSAAPLYGALRTANEAGIARIRAKSLALTRALIGLVDTRLGQPPYDFAIGTPREERRRGGHVAVEHPDAIRLAHALRARGIIPDYRPPNVIRLAPVPLYNTFEEVWRTVQALREIVDRREHEQFSAERDAVA